MNYYIGRVVGDAGSEVIVEADGMGLADEVVRNYFTETMPELKVGAVVETVERPKIKSQGS